jgi:hypothetical protein
MSKTKANPNEIFSFPVEKQTKQAVQNNKKHFCRFLNAQCDKQSRIIPYPMGVCSVNHGNHKPIICPHRFLEDNLVFHDVAQNAFGSVNDVLLFSEVKLNNVGSFDFVLVKHKPISSKIDDFCIVEFQSDSTTGTRKLVDALKDFVSGDNVLEKSYAFGLNTYNTIKLSYIQMLIKGQVMEKWGKQIYWILQKYVFDNMVNRFKLKKMDFDATDKTKFFIYDIFENKDFYNLRLIERKSSTISNLLKAFTHQPTPSLDEFMKILENKINLKLGLTIE